MNRYPAWLNALVLVILLTGLVLALPNIYGSVPAIQLAGIDGADLDETRLAEVEDFLESRSLPPEAAYLEDGRIVLRFDEVALQLEAGEQLRPRYDRQASVALTLAPRLAGVAARPGPCADEPWPRLAWRRVLFARS
jgi:preprotein translocase subunit SecD